MEQSCKETNFQNAGKENWANILTHKAVQWYA